MPLFGMEADGEFIDQQPDHGGSFMSDDNDDLLYPQADQDDDLYTALVMMAVRSFAHGGFYSPAGAAGPARTSSEYYTAFGLSGASRGRARASPAAGDYAHPFPAQTTPPPAVVASEAAIAALEAAEAPADDCCPVCLQEDGAAPAGWRRVAACGHRFHAACVEKWLRVKPSCPVCRCPAAPAPPAAVPGAMN